MRSRELTKISGLQGSRSTEQAIREWLMVFAETYRKNGAPYPLTPVMTGVWTKLLGDLDVDVLNAACRKLAAVGCRREFPIPADVRAQIEQANEKGFAVEAEQEWNRAVEYSTNDWHPDICPSRNARELSPAAWHALTVAGGPAHLFNCSLEERKWARKLFIEDFMLIHETGKNQDLLGDSEAKAILATLTASTSHSERKQLAPVREAPAVHADRTFSRMGTGPVLSQERKPVNPIIEITDEVRERIDAQKKALREKFPDQFRKAEGPTPKGVLA